MSFLNRFDEDSILWFIILFLLLFWCGKGCKDDGCCYKDPCNKCGCEDECGCNELPTNGCNRHYMGGCNNTCC